MLIINLLIFYAFSIIAQRPITLKDATALALKNNHQVRSDEIAIQYQQALVNSAYSLPMTSFSSELGQFNSNYFDAGFAVNQSFSLPKVYKYKQELYKTDTKTGPRFFKLCADCGGNRSRFIALKDCTDEELQAAKDWVEKG
jgi:cobalt-zinc-cadmium resistance protein CzcA